MYLKVSIEQQTLAVFNAEADQNLKPLAVFEVSTALNGVGSVKGSHQTPLGRHQVRAKIGGQQPINAVFIGRRPTGEIFSEDLARRYPKRDWILTRILWLSGLESGHNRLGNVDTMQRYIYIHGTPDSEPVGQPQSHGCIRMHNADVVRLFDWVTVGSVVEIVSC